MSDIPDWLVELAAQQGQEDDEEGEGESEWDFARAQPDEAADVAPPVSFSESPAAPEVLAFDEDMPEGELMDALRSQVDLVEAEEAPAEKPKKNFLDFHFAGLRPWQQLVLAIMVLLDVIVIGFLFLVMLGRVGIP